MNLDRYYNQNHTFIIIKPDIIKKQLEGDILHFMMQYNFKLIRLARINLTHEQAQQLYQHHIHQPFFTAIQDFMCQEVICALLYHANDAVNEMIKLTGVTDPHKADIGTIRNIWGTSITHNAVHRSDSLDSMLKELRIFGNDFAL